MTLGARGAPKTFAWKATASRTVAFQANDVQKRATSPRPTLHRMTHHGSRRVATRILVAAAIVIAAALVVMMFLPTNPEGASTATAPPLASPEQSLPTPPRWVPRPRRAPDVPVPRSDRREALEAEAQAIRAQLRAKIMAFNEKANALREYDPVLCAHMDHPLCPPYAMSEAEIDRLAECGGVKLDMPHSMWRDDEPLFDPRWDAVELTPGERARVESALASIRDDFEAEARKVWAVEAVDEADAAALDLGSINFMLFSTNRPPRFDEALRYAAEEAAGRAPSGSPPVHLRDYVRKLVRAGDSIEATLAEAVGPSKAAELRRAASGWGHTTVSHAGCPEDADATAARAKEIEIEAELAEMDRGSDGKEAVAD